jgi:hypothetical protein
MTIELRFCVCNQLFEKSGLDQTARTANREGQSSIGQQALESSHIS